MIWTNLLPLALAGLLGSSLTTAKPLPPATVGRPQVDAGLRALFSYYNATDGRFDTSASWWLTGNALTAVLEYTDKTHSQRYMPQVLHTIEQQKKPLPWWPSGGGVFRADSTDDTGWYALAMLKTFDITRDPTYLNYAVLDADYLQSFHSDTCGGGIIWDIPSRTYKNAISNELYLALTAGLANRLTDRAQAQKWLQIAKSQYNWIVHSGMTNAGSLFNDGLTDDCKNNGKTMWSYNQGVILGAAVELFHADGHDWKYLELAQRIANAVVTSPAFNSPAGVLVEWCEASGSCNTDQDAFKGIFIRNLAKLNQVLPGAPYTRYIRRQAASAYSQGRNGSDFYGVQWTGPVGQANVGTQGSAVSLLVAAL